MVKFTIKTTFLLLFLKPSSLSFWLTFYTPFLTRLLSTVNTETNSSTANTRCLSAPYNTIKKHLLLFLIFNNTCTTTDLKNSSLLIPLSLSIYLSLWVPWDIPSIWYSNSTSQKKKRTSKYAQDNIKSSRAKTICLNNN